MSREKYVEGLYEKFQSAVSNYQDLPCMPYEIEMEDARLAFEAAFAKMNRNLPMPSVSKFPKKKRESYQDFERENFWMEVFYRMETDHMEHFLNEAVRLCLLSEKEANYHLELQKNIRRIE